MNEIPLVILSVCMEAAIGIMFFLALARLRNRDIDGKLVTFFASIFAVVGSVSALAHLEKPLRAFYPLINIGNSWLSREILFVMLFTGCCVLCLAINIWKPVMTAVLRILERAAALIGVALLFMMGSIYTFASVPAWAGMNTYIEYYTSAVILGAMLFFAATFKQQDRWSNKALGAVTFVALAVQVIGSELHVATLGSAGSAAARMSAEILSASGVLIAVKWFLLIGGVGAFCLRGTIRTAMVAVTASELQSAAVEETAGAAGSQVAWISACAALIAAFIGKVLFFLSMVTTGIGIP